MSNVFEIICLLIISVNKQSVYGSTHALIGNYSELNPKDCGITRFVPNLDYSCFKWHNNIIEGMKGRDATEDEVPWIVLIEIRVTFLNIKRLTCTGGLIADQWVLTASHCLKSDETEQYLIYTGTHSFADPDKTHIAGVTQIIQHPDYFEETESNPPFNDIGLLKLDRSISSINSERKQKQFNQFKSICLPQNNIFNTRQEFAVFGGWGRVDRDTSPLPVGIRKIYPPDDYSWWFSSYVIKTVKMEIQTLICMGDSGGLLWQFDAGRAIIIGVLTYGDTDQWTKCEYPNLDETKSVFFVRVSNYIDWIMDTIKHN